MNEHAPLCVNHSDNIAPEGKGNVNNAVGDLGRRVWNPQVMTFSVLRDDLELLSGLNIAIDYTEETDTVVSLARRQAAFNNAVIALLVQAGVLKPNAGWTEEK